MKIEAKAARRRKGPPKDVRDFCGQLVLTADSEIDEVILAAIHVALSITPDPPFDAWRKEVLERHCTKHNVTVKLSK